jgi:hypothetical protein
MSGEGSFLFLSRLDSQLKVSSYVIHYDLPKSLEGVSKITSLERKSFCDLPSLHL